MQAPYTQQALGRRPAYSEVAVGSSNKIELLLWFAFICLSPFYVFGSGNAQPADYVLVGFIGFRFICGLMIVRPDAKQYIFPVLYLLGWMICVNIVWFAFTLVTDMAKFSLYYLFNALAVLAFASFRPSERKQFIQITALALVVIGIGLAVYIAITNGLRKFDTTRGGRQLAFFNNPNQLAYYCTLSATFVAMISRFKMVPKIVSWLVPLYYFGLLYLSLLTASRAGIAAVVLAALLGFITNGRQLIVGICLMGVIVASGLLEEQSVQRGFSKLNQRIERDRHGSSITDQLTARGFKRVFENAGYVLLGAGEGYDERFYGSQQKAREFHSSIGCMIFSYGMVAIVLVFFCFARLWKLARYNLILVSPPILYGFTHNGLRQVELWMLPMLLIALILYSRQSGQTPRTFVLRKQLANQHSGQMLANH